MILILIIILNIQSSSITDLHNCDYLLPAYYNTGTELRTLQMFNLFLQTPEVHNYFHYTEEETRA